jgi:transcriptional regulator with XRE-family HTH domain
MTEPATNEAGVAEEAPRADAARATADGGARLTAAQEIARAIIEERSLADQLPSETAAAAGLRPVDLAAIERGERLPTGDELRRLIDALGVPAAVFLGALSETARAEAERLLAPETATTEVVAADSPDAHDDEARGGAGEAASAGARKPSPDAARGRARRDRRGSKGGREGAPLTAGEEIPVNVQVVRACLAAFFEQVHERTRGEIVYGWEYGRRFGAKEDMGLLVKVYTSISGQSLRARPIGDDAIRVLVYDRRSKRKVEAWSCRINRTGDWPKRLRRLAGEAVMRATYRPRCRRCAGRPECEVRGNPGAQFWGCPNFRTNRCQFTRDIVVAARPAPLGEVEEAGLTVGTPERQRQPRPRPRATPDTARKTPEPAAAAV